MLPPCRPCASCCRLPPTFADLRRELGVREDFPPEVLAEAERAAAAPEPPDEDLTALPFVTVDPEESRDLDQAVHLERAGGGLPGALRDRRRRRPSSAPAARSTRRCAGAARRFYAPDRRVPLHPPVLGEGAASLLPEQVRPAVVWELRARRGRRARPRSTSGGALVRSVAKLSYDGVQAQYDAGTADELLLLLREVGRLRQERAAERGAVDLPALEQEVDVGRRRPAGALAAPAAAGGGLERADQPAHRRGRRRRHARRRGRAAAHDAAAGRRGRRVAAPQRPRPGPAVAGGDVVRAPPSRRSTRPTPVRRRCSCSPPGCCAAPATPRSTAPRRRWPRTARWPGRTRTRPPRCAGWPTATSCRPASRSRPGSRCRTTCGRRCPSCPRVMAAADRAAGALDRAGVDLAEALVLAPRVGERFPASVVERGAERGVVQLVDPPVRARCEGADLPLGEHWRSSSSRPTRRRGRCCSSSGRQEQEHGELGVRELARARGRRTAPAPRGRRRRRRRRRRTARPRWRPRPPTRSTLEDPAQAARRRAAARRGRRRSGCGQQVGRRLALPRQPRRRRRLLLVHASPSRPPAVAERVRPRPRDSCLARHLARAEHRTACEAAPMTSPAGPAPALDPTSLTVAVLGGTGEQGRGLARRLALAGVTVVLGSRARGARGRGGRRAARPGVRRRQRRCRRGRGRRRRGRALGRPPRAARRRSRGALEGKVVVDCVNPLGFDKQGAYALPVEEGSAAQQAQAVLPGSRVVGAFHHVSAVLLLDESVDVVDTDVMVLGDDREATDLVQALAALVPGMRGRVRRAAAQRPPGRGAHRQPHLGEPPLQGARRPARHRRVSTDDLGREVPVPARVQRVVSLVPSLTEAVAVTAPGLLVGATDWCSHPADLDVARVRGTKNPDVAGRARPRPRPGPGQRRGEPRESTWPPCARPGVAVWTTFPRSVPESLASPGQDARAPAGWTSPLAARRRRPPGRRRTAARAGGRSCRCGGGRGWRWAAAPSPATCCARLGVDNVLADSPERYPRFTPAGRRRRPGRAARRAVPVHARRRAGGVPGRAGRAASAGGT